MKQVASMTLLGSLWVIGVGNYNIAVALEPGTV